MRHLLFLLALPIFAQQQPDTTVWLDQVQMRPNARPPVPVVLMVISGKVTSVQLGAGVVLNTATNPPTLGAMVTTPVIVSFPITAAATTLTLPDVPLASTLACWKNGILVSLNYDYTLSGAVLTFQNDAAGGPGNAPAVGDLFTCSYQR